MFKNERISLFGKMMVLEGSILLVPLLLLPFFPDEIKYVGMFIVPGGISIGIGLLMCILVTQRKVNSNRLVVASWLYGFFLAAIPFYLYGNLSGMQALFESVSGFTTTGLSVLDVSRTPQLFLFYRSYLQFIGGLGFVMMMLIFVQGKDSVKLYQAEGHPDLLAPHIGKTVMVIVKMYSFFLVIGTIAYTLVGMPIFDSLLHAMCALSTGGFSNRLESIGYYNSPLIEGITILLMVIGTTNFSLLLLLFKGKWREFLQSSEIRFMLALTTLFIPIMTLLLVDQGIGFKKGFRLALFNAFSALSTTGYATCNYTQWCDTVLVLMIILMVIGGGIGSTAGGMKLGRVCIALKQLWKDVKGKVAPQRRVLLASYSRGAEKEILTSERVEEARTYISVYFGIFLCGSLLIAYVEDCSFLYSAFEFASSLGTVGLSIGITNMETSQICLLIEIIGMIMGRLEIFILLKIFIRRQI